MRATTAAAIALAATAAAWWWREQQPDDEAPEPGTDYSAPIAGAWGWTMEQIDPIDEARAQANQAAFLRTIRVAEGTAGPNGYRTAFGGALFNSYADHPRLAHRFTDKRGRQLWTSAAGAYQFLAVSPIPGSTRTTTVDTWDRLKRKLRLADFSPGSQDLAAVELIDEAGALYDVRAGRFAAAIDKVRRTWASLPGAGYSQPERSLESLRIAYVNAGGDVA